MTRNMVGGDKLSGLVIFLPGPAAAHLGAMVGVEMK